MENNNLHDTLNSLFEGLDRFVTAKTVVGEPIHINDTIILPLVDVLFGVGGGGSASNKEDSGAGGLGGKLQPSAILVIKDGNIRLVNVKNQDTLTKVLDIVPDLANKLNLNFGNKSKDEDILKDLK